MVVQWNVVDKTKKWNSGKVMVEQCGGTVRWNSVGGRAWWNSGTVIVEQ